MINNFSLTNQPEMSIIIRSLKYTKVAVYRSRPIQVTSSDKAIPDDKELNEKCENLTQELLIARDKNFSNITCKCSVGKHLKVVLRKNSSEIYMYVTTTNT